MRALLFYLIASFVFSTASAQIIVNAGGDVNFNRDVIPARAQDTFHKGRRHLWEDMTLNLRGHFDRGLNFANIEAVVSDKKLKKYNKKWNFLSHPNSIQHLINLGFNLFSVANNHTYDYRHEGIVETDFHMKQLASKNPGVYWHGVGHFNETSRPTEFFHNGIKVAFSALGIFRPSKLYSTNSRIGALGYRNNSHFNAVLEGLRNSDAAFKILSLHQGKEGVTSITKAEIRAFRRAVDEAGVNFVIGHHPHVARPVEIYKGSLIAYSLGNLLLVGAANQEGRSIGKNYGLVLKAEFNWNSELNKYSPSFVEALPFKGVHIQPYEPSTATKRKHINYLNKINRNAFGQHALQFSYNQNTNQAVYR